MYNHKDIFLNYDPTSIVDILQGYALPEDESVYTTACSITEIEKISKVLNLGLPIRSILFFRMGKNFKGLIHKDVNLNLPNLVINHALNLPLINCEEVYMKWFTQNDLNVNAIPFEGPSSGSPTPLLDRNNSTCIDSVKCNTTKLVSVNDWHVIENHSLENYAYLISIRFASHVIPSMDLPITEWINR
jgi:hypothetical protein